MLEGQYYSIVVESRVATVLLPKLLRVAISEKAHLSGQVSKAIKYGPPVLSRTFI